MIRTRTVYHDPNLGATEQVSQALFDTRSAPESVRSGLAIEIIQSISIWDS
jgi:hypothetical protein